MFLQMLRSVKLYLLCYWCASPTHKLGGLLHWENLSSSLRLYFLIGIKLLKVCVCGGVRERERKAVGKHMRISGFNEVGLSQQKLWRMTALSVLKLSASWEPERVESQFVSTSTQMVSLGSGWTFWLGVGALQRVFVEEDILRESNTTVTPAGPFSWGPVIVVCHNREGKWGFTGERAFVLCPAALPLMSESFLFILQQASVPLNHTWADLLFSSLRLTPDLALLPLKWLRLHCSLNLTNVKWVLHSGHNQEEKTFLGNWKRQF